MIEQVVIPMADQALFVGLPKWPALTIRGQRVTVDQAAEILIRTDSHLPSFRYSCNDRPLERELCSLFGLPNEDDLPRAELNDHWERLESLRKSLRMIDLEYLTNDQIVSAWIGGPHGWCAWDGTIGSSNYNIGKWPSCEEVYAELCRVAHAFPYLDMDAHLFDGETCEDGTKPVVGFRVKDGQVTTHAPNLDALKPTELGESDIMKLVTEAAADRESGISVGELCGKLIKLYGGAIPQLSKVGAESPLKLERVRRFEG